VLLLGRHYTQPGRLENRNVVASVMVKVKFVVIILGKKSNFMYVFSRVTEDISTTSQTAHRFTKSVI